MKKEITLPIEVMEKLANILFQDMNFHNPHEIIVEARGFLLELGITIKVITPISGSPSKNRGLGRLGQRSRE